MPYLLLLFIAMPIIEIALLLRVGEAFGWWPTLLMVIATAILGSSMLRQQGLATLNKARTRMDSGEMPAQQLLEGLIIMIGGVLLLTPGLVTDLFGFLCLIPLTRQWLAAQLSTRAFVGISGGMGFSPRSGPSGQSTGASGKVSRKSSSGDQGDIIDGDFERIDD